MYFFDLVKNLRFRVKLKFDSFLFKKLVCLVLFFDIRVKILVIIGFVFCLYLWKEVILIL